MTKCTGWILLHDKKKVFQHPNQLVLCRSNTLMKIIAKLQLQNFSTQCFREVKKLLSFYCYCDQILPWSRCSQYVGLIDYTTNVLRPSIEKFTLKKSTKQALFEGLCCGRSGSITTLTFVGKIILRFKLKRLKVEFQLANVQTDRHSDIWTKSSFFPAKKYHELELSEELLRPLRLGTCGSMRGPVNTFHCFRIFRTIQITFTSTTVSSNSLKIFIS